MSRILTGIFLIFLLSPSAQSEASPTLALDYSQRRSQTDSPFEVPATLRRRVDFWKDVFARYGKFQSVIHHREFPQVRFGVIDLSEEGSAMGPVQFEKYKKREVERRVKEVHEALLRLADGREPTNLLDDIVSREMKSVPGGPEKYRRAVDEDLVRTQTGIRERYAEAIKRSGRYMHFIEDIFVKEHSLPIELTRLPFVESSFDYTAYSSVGAAGIWQFMPKTAKSYKMTVNSVVDERRDPIEATRGAAQYLKTAYNQLGDWPLAVTSYNHGVAGVKRKVQQYGTDQLDQLIEHRTERPFGFASSNFYPEFLAAIEIYNDWKSYFPEVQMDAPVHMTVQRVTAPIGASHAAQKLNLSTEQLRAVNYALSEGVWKGRFRIPAGYQLRIPKGLTTQMARLQIDQPVKADRGPASSAVYGGATYSVRKGDSILSIAKRFGVSVGQIKRLNNLDSETIYPGQTLVVRTGTGTSVASAGAQKLLKLDQPQQQSASTLVKEVRDQKEQKKAPIQGMTYRVRKGDSLTSIAKRFGVPLEELKRRNSKKDTFIKAGEKLVIQ